MLDLAFKFYNSNAELLAKTRKKKKSGMFFLEAHPGKGPPEDFCSSLPGESTSSVANHGAGGRPSRVNKSYSSPLVFLPQPVY